MKVALRVLLCVAFLSVVLLAADKPKKSRLVSGDKVEFDFNGKVQGEVVEINSNGWIKVKFSKDGVEMTPTLPPDKVRAIAKKDKEEKPDDSRKSSGAQMRSWTDKTGKFKVTAKFVELKDGNVTLETDENKTVVLPVDKLSKDDQKVARDLAKEAEENPFQVQDENPFESGAKKSPAGSRGNEKVEMTDADWSTVKSITPDQTDKWSLKPDEAPVFDKPPISKPIILASAVKSKPDGGQFSVFEHVDSLLFDRARGQAFVVVHEAVPVKPAVNRIQRVDLVSGKVQEPIEFPSVMKPVDVDASGSLIVARSDNHFSGNSEAGISVWKLGDDGLKHVRSWSPVEPGDFFKSQASLAKFVDSDHVITVSFPTKLTMWQVSKARAIYKIEIGHGGAAAVSAGGKYLAVPFQNGLFVLDALSGKTLGKLAGEPGMINALSFRPDGRQLAAISPQRLIVWDLEKGHIYRDFYFPQAFPVTTIDWIGKGHLLLGGERAVDLEKRVVLWQYQHDAGSGFSRGYGEAAGDFWYALTSPDRKERALYHVKLPHDEALKAASSLNVEKLLSIHPGVTVALHVTVQGTPAEQQQVQQDLTTQLQTLGMSVASGGQLVLQASTEVGKTQDITYRSFAGGGNQTAKVTEQICRLKFVDHGKVIWESSSLTDGSPPMLQMKQGQSLQDALAPYQKPNLKFYSNINLPQYVARPGETVAYGASSLTAQGIKPAAARSAKPGVAGR